MNWNDYEFRFPDSCFLPEVLSDTQSWTGLPDFKLVPVYSDMFWIPFELSSPWSESPFTNKLICRIHNKRIQIFLKKSPTKILSFHLKEYRFGINAEPIQQIHNPMLCQWTLYFFWFNFQICLRFDCQNWCYYYFRKSLSEIRVLFLAALTR